jgi:hypothetical protein
MRYLYIILFLFFSFSLKSKADNVVTKYTISGYVKDAKNGEALSNAAITAKDKNQNATSNAYGFYSLSLEPGNYEIIYNLIGYEQQIKKISLTGNITENIELEAAQKDLGTFTVKDKRKNQNVEKVEMGTIQISAAQIKKIPAVLGEADVIKSIQLLPGVSTIGEGATGFNVRGGSVDQNLILIDEAPVYNSSHALGFFSVFNPDAVKDVKLIKGGIPASYGGRLSSVLDIRMKEGNMKKFSGAGGIGTIFSRLMLEGPVVKNKASFMIAARRSYFDAFFPLASNEGIKKSGIHFLDLNGKINWVIDKKNRVYLSTYYGRDLFRFSDFFKISWGNQNATLRWNHLYNSRNFANYSLISSNFDYELGIPTGSLAFKWVSHIRFYNAKADHTYYINSKNTLTYGANVIFYNFNPGQLVPVAGATVFTNQLALIKKNALEPCIYVNNEQVANKTFSFQYGVRYNQFITLGPDTLHQFADPNNRSGDNITGSIIYKKGEVQSFYHGLEPRLAFKATVDKYSSVKGSYNRTRQNIHLITNTSSASPLDIYLPTDKYLKPQFADQGSLGYFRNFGKNMYETSVEMYYKKFHNLIDFKDGSNLIANRYLDTTMLMGKGYSYGTELYIRKTEGKLTGWISYTYSRTRRQINGINNSQYYFAPYDKTHSLSITACYELTKRITLSSNFIYSTGIAITVPGQKYEWQGITLSQPTERNSVRIPAYHRADIAATIRGKKHKVWQGEWVISAYNLYARRNAYSIFFRQNAKDPTTTEAVRVSIFGSIIPSITYNFNF